MADFHAPKVTKITRVVNPVDIHTPTVPALKEDDGSNTPSREN